MKKNIKGIIVVLILSLIFVVIAILNMRKEVDNKQLVTNTEIQKNRIENNREYYYYAVSGFENFLYHMKTLNSGIEDLQIMAEGYNKEKVLEKQKEKSLSAIWEMLDKEYIDKTKITRESLQKKLQKFSIEDINIDKVNLIEKSDDIYLAIVYSRTKETLNEINLIMKIDLKNNTYSLFLDEYLNEELNNINIESIEKNDNNTYQKVKITDKIQTIKYFNCYKQNALKYPELAYEMLDENYRSQKFGTYNNYVKYLQSQTNFSTTNLEQYAVNEHENYIEFVGLDRYGNKYYFKETTIMDYKVRLDDYTILSDEFIKKFDSTNEQGKVALCIDKFIRALNDKSYYYIYNSLLSQGFKENYFPTLEHFEEYAKKTFYNKNSAAYVDAIITKEDGLYTYKIQIKNTENYGEEKIEKKFIVKLNKDRTFEMSFNVD